MKRKITIGYLIILVVFTIYVLGDTFLIRRTYDSTAVTSVATNTVPSATAENESTGLAEALTLSTEKTSSNVTVTDTTYESDGLRVEISTYREYDTDIYVADIYFTDLSAFSTAFAEDTYGKNITDKTSQIAEDNDAVIAINGDYYGAQEKGYVIKNGVLYRSTARNNAQDLVIYTDGTWEIINESEITAEELMEKGAYQLLSFGPGLIVDGEISVSTDYEVGKAMASNPRTAIGYIDEGHYVFVVSDGRTSTSEGLSVYQLAEFMESLGVETAYNLDGGGSSTMVFNGEVINNPTTSGNKIKERSVSDIVYFG